MNAQATEEFRVRIDRNPARQARQVAAEIGTSPEDEVLGPAKRRTALWDATNEGKPSAR
jgi:hypothetical protein